MRIAFFVSLFPSVSETFILNQVVGLLERGHEVYIYADYPPEPLTKIHADVERFRLLDRTQYRVHPPVAWPARVRSAASLVMRWGWRNPRATLDSFNVLRHGRMALDLRLLHEQLPPRQVEDYDVIHSHFGPNGNRALNMREGGFIRGPIITTFYGYDANLLPRIYGAGLYERLFNHGELFTVGSEFLRNRILSLGAPENRIAKLPMGADVGRYRFIERRKSDDGGFRLLTVARLVEVKGIEYAIRAVGLARNKCSGLRYTIAGEGPLRRGLQQLTTELGLADTVEFLGAVSQEEGLRLYDAAHAFVLPSIATDFGEEEGQPIVLAEAQASGLPIIATAIGGIPESIREGESRFLVPPRNPEAMASAMIRLADHPEAWSAMGRAGRAHVEKLFNLEKLHDQLVDIYRMVLAGRNGKSSHPESTSQPSA